MSEQSTMSRQGIMIEVVIPSSKGLVKTKKGLPEIGMKIKINNEEKTITLDQFITESFGYFQRVVELENEIGKLREETTKYSNKITAFLDAMKGV